MATVLSKKKSTYGNPYAFYTLKLTQSERKEKSVKISYEIISSLQYAESWLGYALNAKITVGGVSSGSIALKGTETWSGTAEHKKTGSFTVDGLSSTDTSLTVYFEVDNPSTTQAELSKTKCTSLTIPVYAKATTPSLSATSVTLGNKITIDLSSRLLSSYKHTIKWAIGSKSGTVVTKTSSEEVSFTPSVELATEITKSMSGTVTITCQTYNSSGTLIGTKTKTLTVKVPATVVPSIKNIVIDEAVSQVKTNFGTYVKGLSQLAISITAEGIHGSSITSCSTVVDGTTYKGTEFTSGVLKNKGTIYVTTTVKDSRGQHFSEKIAIEVTDYFNPSVDIGVSVVNTTAYITISGKVAKVSNLNSKSLEFKYKSMEDESYTDYPIDITNDDWTFSRTIEIEGLDPVITYEFVAKLTDKNTYASDTAQSGVVVISRLAGGKGITFGGEAEEEGIIGKWPFKGISVKTIAGADLDMSYKNAYYAGNISSNEDLNNYTASGVYFCNSNDIAPTLANSPTTVAFRLEVIGTAAAGHTTRLWQLLWTNAETEGAMRCYKRQLGKNGWSAWKKEFYWSDLKISTSTKTTNSNGNIALQVDPSKVHILSATFDISSGSTTNCSVYVNGGKASIHVANNSAGAIANTSGTLRYVYIEL